MMAKCKDCLHMELCARDERLTDFTPEQEALCQFFVDRHRYVVREKGEWVYDHWCEFKCSKCGALSKTEPRGEENFCPNCGADMRRRENG